jgi:hypothetical protein
MQNATVDKKIQILYDNYKENFYAKSAQQEVEAYRNKSFKLGAGISTAAFVGNEFVRLTHRSGKYFSAF